AHHLPVCRSLSFSRPSHPRALHSFPTRRSSDLGTLNLSAWCQTVSDCGCTPATPQNTTTAPSRTRRLRSTSIVKSTWPGVSIRRSEEHTSELQHVASSYAVFCLKKKKPAEQEVE